ncbi:hypothetical protein TNCV_2156301 [Trichonephila clavipes]|nr:hypothetical protein TNCV_2156301 [Trichonephila clavipes]
MTPKSPNWQPTWSPNRMSTWLYCQDLAKFLLNHHYNDGQTHLYALTRDIVRNRDGVLEPPVHLFTDAVGPDFI